MSEEAAGLVSAYARARRLRAARSITAFLAVSLAAHAALLVALPPPGGALAPPKIAALELVTLAPESATAAPPVTEPAAPPAPSSMAELDPVLAQALPNPRPDRQGPILALPEPPPSPERSFAVGAPFAESEIAPVPALTPVPSEQRTQVASTARTGAPVAGVAATPPAFNAAYLRNPAPRYPLAARRAGEEGTVTLRVLVTRDGLPARVDVEKTSGSVHLDNAALEAVKAWRFVPARRGEETLESWVLVPIVFRLEGVS